MNKNELMECEVHILLNIVVVLLKIIGDKLLGIEKKNK